MIGFAAQRCERVGAAARARRFVVPSSYVLFFVVAGGSCAGATSSSLLPRFFVVSSSSSRYVTRAHACAMRSDVTRATVTVETATVTAIATVVGRKRPGQNRPGDSGNGGRDRGHGTAFVVKPPCVGSLVLVLNHSQTTTIPERGLFWFRKRAGVEAGQKKTTHTKTPQQNYNINGHKQKTADLWHRASGPCIRKSP